MHSGKIKAIFHKYATRKNTKVNNTELEIHLVGKNNYLGKVRRTNADMMVELNTGILSGWKVFEKHAVSKRSWSISFNRTIYNQCILHVMKLRLDQNYK